MSTHPNNSPVQKLDWERNKSLSRYHSRHIRIVQSGPDLFIGGKSLPFSERAPKRRGSGEGRRRIVIGGVVHLQRGLARTLRQPYLDRAINR